MHRRQCLRVRRGLLVLVIMGVRVRSDGGLVHDRGRILKHFRLAKMSFDCLTEDLYISELL